MMVFAAAGAPTAASVTVVIGFPPGPLPGKVWGPPLTSSWPHAPRRKTRLPAVASRAAGAKRVCILIAGRRQPSRKLDLAATTLGAWHRTHGTTDIGHDDAGCGFAAQLARFIDGLLERRLHAFGEFPQRLIERARLDLKPER